MVLPGTAVDDVVAVAPVALIVARTAVDEVVADPARDLVLAAAAVDPVIPTAAVDDVVPVAAADEVVAAVAVDAILPSRPRMQSEPAVPFRVSLLDVPIMMFVPAGQQDGSSPSAAVTVWVAVAVPPAALVAVHVTTVSPSGNLAGALFVTRTLQLPVAVA